MADGEPVFVTIRGDLEVNEVKLKERAPLRRPTLRRGRGGAGRRLVAPRGWHSVRKWPIRRSRAAQFVVGANKPDNHMTGANYPRDFEVDLLTDIALAQPGQLCAQCGGELEATRGVEVDTSSSWGRSSARRWGPTTSTRRAATYPSPWAATASALGGCWRRPSSRTTTTGASYSHIRRALPGSPSRAEPFQ